MAKNKDQDKEEKKVKPRKMVIDAFLIDSDRPEPIKKMMRSMFRGETHTLEQWARIDKNLNERRVK